MTEAQQRAPRADSVRNRTKILDAAREQITAHGPGVGMNDIALSAGVAVGTLYRHFPTKTDLVAAVVQEFVTRVAARAEASAARVDADHPAFDELAGLLREIVRAATSNHAAKAAAVSLNADIDDSADVQRAHRALESLIKQAKVSKDLRDDLSIDDFYLVITNVPADHPPELLDRWVDLMLFGIAGPARR